MDIVFSLFPFLVMLLMVAMPLLFFGGIFYVILRASKKGQERIATFQNFAREMGWQYVGRNSISNLPGATVFYLFSLGSTKSAFGTINIGRGPEYKRVDNLVCGAVDDLRVSIFDYTYIYSNRRGAGRHQTVVMIDSPQLNLPLFCLRPEGGGLQQLGQLFGGQDIDFSTHPLFSQKYLLRGNNERHIRQVFSRHILSNLETTEGLSAEGGGNRLLVYRHGILTDPAKLRAMFEEARQIVGLFAKQGVLN